MENIGTRGVERRILDDRLKEWTQGMGAENDCTPNGITPQTASDPRRLQLSGNWLVVWVYGVYDRRPEGGDSSAVLRLGEVIGFGSLRMAGYEGRGLKYSPGGVITGRELRAESGKHPSERLRLDAACNLGCSTGSTVVRSLNDLSTWTR
ncbi:hypothetical protein B0H34DRAFT_809071 [Crassisporium funariophilum]|nr:hypothetical protein B0H34DRAFT_809071 [Crassisporium funariophilum]